ncbi:2Fe-2S iron-sulfur cluster-binding protein [Sneathiella sp.]|jgi:2Fe-2S ferredoxin|uniref:2Fe-2S iron-sulfur cluster-binding protein n=1 Tax=Sneathiella sp. TaxID=1964365 RepID=UPI0025EAC567|nr:2Fe-2S iron-sulfur cluster-binding protein [Sneathiella sp.]|tara:strand:- start:259 stop:579 length:321 start_codon:yes stop_codon:yes gene_type:complete
MMRISVTDTNGTQHDIEAKEGDKAMEAIRDSGLTIAALCGGCCSCATCHVYVSDDWADKLPPRSEDEEALLELVAELRPASRLSCQIIMEPAFDGIELELSSDTNL